MSATAKSIGRARTVLVFGEGDGATAIISTAVAQTRDFNAGERIRFVGPVTFEEHTARHVGDMLVPTVDAISKQLGIPRRSFDVSVVNPGAASVSDLGVEISGFSADVPILLAMLSAALHMPISDGIVTTGHIASCDGDIGNVKALPVKIMAALEDRTIRHFVYPAIDGDIYLAALSPRETEKAKIAVIKAKGRLRLTAVRHVADLAKVVFTDEAIVAASLHEGFFAADGLQKRQGNPISLVVRFLAKNNDVRFWNVLERYLHAGESEKAKTLLLARSQFHIRNRAYPKEFGRTLIQLLRSVPTVVRRLKISFPLLPTLTCAGLSQFAAESDDDDIRLLFDAAAGKGIWTEPTATKMTQSCDKKIDQKDQAAVDAVISEIDSSALARAVGVPIDTARSTYMLDSLSVESSEQFYDCISSFYLHLLRHVNSPSESLDRNAVKADAMALIDRIFYNKGGLRAAMNEACEPVHGGMKFILDFMTEQFKIERRSKHINRVIKEALNPMEPDAQISFIRALLQRLAPHLPPEIVSAPPERFAKDDDEFKVLVMTYVKSLDHITAVFRRF